MLRTVLMAIGVASLFGAATAVATGAWPSAIWLTINGLALTAGIAWERWRYRQPDTRLPGAGWQRTSERFIDPETGRLTEVWFQPDTGERRYVVQP